MMSQYTVWYVIRKAKNGLGFGDRTNDRCDTTFFAGDFFFVTILPLRLY